MQDTLTDNVVLLRPLIMSDADALYASIRESITELCRWLPWAHRGYAPTDATEFIEFAQTHWAARSQFTFGIFGAATGSHAGVIGINHLNPQHLYANIGYWVRTERTKRGLCSRAVRLAAGYAFDVLGMTRIEIAADPDNLASRRAAEKAGATFETIARNRIVMDGEARPAAVYSLIPEDLKTED